MTRRRPSSTTVALCAGALAIAALPARADLNWPWAPPPNAVPPQVPQPKVDRPPDDDCKTFGSVLECQSQVVGETARVVGTPFSLHYGSDRVLGRKAAYQVVVPLSGASVPPGLVRIDLVVFIAGRRVTQSFPPTANQSTPFAWDGNDAYGRRVRGGAQATIRIGYVYRAVYTTPYTLAGRRSFGRLSGLALLGFAGAAIPGRFEAILYQESRVSLGTLDAQDLGFGGWTLDVHHVYSPTFGSLYRGDGSRRDASNVLGSNVINTVAGIGNPPTYNGDNQPATNAAVSTRGIAVGPDASIYIADRANCRIRKVTPDGIIHTFAGTGLGSEIGICDTTTIGNGDGGPANQARVDPFDLALGPDGSVYLSEGRSFRVRRIRPDGIIETFAGTGALPTTDSTNGDGGPAAQAAMNPQAVAAGPDGSVYIADLAQRQGQFGTESFHRVRRVGTDGVITNFAGGPLVAGFGGDGGPATQATFTNIRGLAVAPDGGVLIVSTADNRVRRVGTDGIIQTIAGTGAFQDGGDGGPAAQASLSSPAGVAAAADGTIYIASQRVRRIGTDGIITTVAGGGPSGTFQDGVPATVASVLPQRLAVFPDGTLCTSETLTSHVRRVGSALPTLGPQQFLIASENGDELFVFSAEGLHLRTLDARTAAVRELFGYDAAGRLISITDGDGNVTTVQRDASGNAIAIVAPGGQRTSLSLDGNGYLRSIADPSGAAVQMTYTADGLMLSRTDARGNLFQYGYDALGRLVQETEPTGGVKTLTRTESPNGYVVTLTTPLGRTTTYEVALATDGSIVRINSDPAGALTTVVTRPDGSQTATLPDGTTVVLTLAPDPRFGMMVPRLRSRRRTLPGGQVESITGQHTATLSDVTNLLSLATQTDTLTVNGRVFIRAYDAATRTLTDTSAQGRKTSLSFDAQGRVVKSVMDAGLTPVTMTYDLFGRLVEQRQGTSFWSFAWDASNRMVSRSDAAGRTFGYGYDLADRVVAATLPSGATYGFSYDPSGNLTAITLPGGAVHALSYTSLDQHQSYTPPSNGSYSRAYDLDRRLTGTTLPGGRVKSQAYDAAGRVATLSDADALTTVTYPAGDPTDRAGTIAHAPSSGAAQSIDLGYDGLLVSSTSATGAAPSQTSYAFDNNFFLSQLTLASGADSFQAAVAYDRDGLLSSFGPFSFARAGPDGATSAVADAVATTAYGYDASGRLVSRTHQVAAGSVYTIQLSYDQAGRIVGKAETVGGTPHDSSYVYNADGELSSVSRDGVVESYGYDLDGNRVNRLSASTTEDAIYDAQDRLLRRGGTSYLFDADGFLAQRGADTFRYDARGQLVAAFAGGQSVAYGYDGLGRRISRSDAAGTTQYFYADLSRPLITAMRGPAGDFTAFHYDTDGFVVALDRGGARYYVACDQLGSPRVVSDATGAIVKTVEYDAFGNLVADSNPAFALEIGFAGGLQDAATGLAHFGARDYEPASGRWTARDPLLFDGGQGNLYVYAGNDPVGSRDPSGLFCMSVTGYDGVGGGVTTCITDEGASVCFEVGFGVGITVGVDNGGLDRTGTKDGIEVSAKCFDAGLGADLSLDDTGCLKYGWSGQRDDLKAKFDRNKVKGQIKGSVAGAPKLKLSKNCSVSGKVYGKVCKQGKF